MAGISSLISCYRRFVREKWAYTNQGKRGLFFLMSAKLFGDQQSHQTVLSKVAQAFKLHCQRLYQLFVGGMALISPVPKACLGAASICLNCHKVSKRRVK